MAQVLYVISTFLGMVGINFGSDWFEPENEFSPADWDASEQMMQVSYHMIVEILLNTIL